METNPLTILCGDALEQLRTLPDESIHCCVTSPPYWGLRDYSTNGQLGLEKTPEEYVAKMVQVFREVRRVLRKDGTCWVNMGDGYLAQQGSGFNGNKRLDHASNNNPVKRPKWLKPKDLVGMPWRLAFALQADGWWLRSDIIWAKPNPMPESVTDRPTKAHEYLFLLTKASSYFYDAEAIKERSLDPEDDARRMRQSWENGKDKHRETSISAFYAQSDSPRIPTGNRNKRSVWTVATAPYPEAHFATYPPDLIKPCILAGSRLGDTILDPFAGSGTTGAVALELGRKAVLIELNLKYVELIKQRCNVTMGLALA